MAVEHGLAQISMQEHGAQHQSGTVSCLDLLRQNAAQSCILLPMQSSASPGVWASRPT